MITQGELRNLLDYDPETGLWRWRSATGRKKIAWFSGTPSTQGYTRIMVDGRSYKAHTLAWLYVYGEWRPQLDHINRHAGDNRIVNLRPSTKSTNGINANTRSDNTSGHTGVSWDESKKSWIAYVTQNRRRYRKCFVDRKAAIAWREAKARELFGEFANVVTMVPTKDVV